MKDGIIIAVIGAVMLAFMVWWDRRAADRRDAIDPPLRSDAREKNSDDFEGYMGKTPPGTCLLCGCGTDEHIQDCPVSIFNELMLAHPDMDPTVAASDAVDEHARRTGEL